jgi:hypothetical protein
MRRIRIQKRRPAGLANEQLQGGWKSVEVLTTTTVTVAPLSNDERAELEQRRRLYGLIQEHAVA